MVQRIKTPEWKDANRKRWLDLRDSLKSDVVNLDLFIEPNNQQLREMRLVEAIAKLHSVELKD